MTRLPLELDFLQQLSWRAGEQILAIYNTGFTVTEKPDNTPVTEADMAAHRLIVDALRQATPDIPVLSEESASILFDQRRGWSRYWLIDPLDGTREFIKRNGEFTVNIALVENGLPQFGIIHAPVTGVLYWGGPGMGAWRQEPGGSATRIETTRPASQPLRVATSRSRPGARTQRVLQRLGDYRLQPMGSSLKSCLVAEGKADLYLRYGPTSEWDTAAAQAVVEAAGGSLTDTRLQPLRYNTKPSLINPDFLVFGDPQFHWADLLRD